MRPGLSLAFALALLVVPAFASPTASAHAVYVSSTPPAYGILPLAPTGVSVTLSESVQPGTQTIRVTNAAGSRVDAGAAQISGSDPRTVSVDLAPIGPGVYTVAWLVEDAVDGHWTSDSFYFMVQNPDGSLPGCFPGQSPPSTAVSPAEVLLRFAAFFSLAIAFGGTVFAMMAWIPAGRDLDAAGEPKYEMGFRGLLTWARLGALLFAGAAGGWWVHAVTETPPEVVPAIIGSSFSISLVVRALLGLAMAGVLSLAIARSTRGTSPDGPPDPVHGPGGSEDALLPLLAAGALGIAAVLAGSAGSHAAATSVPLAGVALDSLHEVGVFAWLGGLLALFRLRPWLRGESLLPLTRQVYSRFSRLAGYAVALVLGAGVVLAILLVGSVDALLGTPYGWTLLAKVSLFIPMVGIGAYNRYRLLPASSAPEKASSSVGSLTRDIRFEAGIGAVVLILAAVLTASVPPASGPVTAYFVLQSTVDGVRVDFQVTPFPSSPGTYTFQILLWNATTGLEFDQTTGANLTFTLVNGTPSPRTEVMDGPHGNHYVLDSPALSSPGTWRIDAVIDRTSAPALRATFNVAMSGVLSTGC